MDPLAEMEDEVVLDIEVPFWIESEDVKVVFRPHGLSVVVRNAASIEREYWSRYTWPLSALHMFADAFSG